MNLIEINEEVCMDLAKMNMTPHTINIMIPSLWYPKESPLEGVTFGSYSGTCTICNSVWELQNLQKPVTYASWKITNNVKFEGTSTIQVSNENTTLHK
jgi:hypothetical protein